MHSDESCLTIFSTNGNCMCGGHQDNSTGLLACGYYWWLFYVVGGVLRNHLYLIMKHFYPNGSGRFQDDRVPTVRHGSLNSLSMKMIEITSLWPPPPSSEHQMKEEWCWSLQCSWDFQNKGPKCTENGLSLCIVFIAFMLQLNIPTVMLIHNNTK